MALLVLAALACLAAVLAILAALARAETGRVASIAAAAAGAGLIALVLLDGGGAPAALPLPLGPPVGSPALSLDAVSLAFGLPLLLGAACSLAACRQAEVGRFAALAAAALLIVVAGDESVLVAGATLAAAAAWGIGVETIGALLLAIGVAAPMLPGGGIADGDGFAILRLAAAPDAGGSWLGAACLVGLASLFAGRRPRRLPGAEALLAAIGTLVAVRFAFDLDGPAAAARAIGLAAAAVGLWLGVLAARAALLSTTLSGALAAMASVGGALALFDVGIASLARASDLPLLAGAAIGALLLLLAALAAAVPLAVFAGRRIAAETGSELLSANGGLAAAAPRLSALLAYALLTLAMLPFGAGFAPLWLLIDLLLRPQMLGGSTLPVLAMLALPAVALVLAVTVAAGFRVAAVLLLGRPRTPRASAAGDLARPERSVFAWPVALLAALTLMPGPALRLVAPATRLLAGPGVPGGGGPFAIGGLADGAVLPVPALLVAVLIGGAVRRLLAPPRPAEDPVHPWDGGAEDPPRWLPFGEPLAQVSAPGLARDLLSAWGVEPEAASLPGEHAADGARRQGGPWRIRRRAASVLRRGAGRAAFAAARSGWGDATLGGRRLLALLGIAAVLVGALLGGHGGGTLDVGGQGVPPAEHGK